jgi:hypothetical protein
VTWQLASLLSVELSVHGLPVKLPGPLLAKLTVPVGGPWPLTALGIATVQVVGRPATTVDGEQLTLGVVSRNRYAPLEAAEPTTAVSPEIDTAEPNWSPAAPSDAVSLAVSVALTQPEEGIANVYAAPCPPLLPILALGAPATTVLPETATL